MKHCFLKLVVLTNLFALLLASGCDQHVAKESSVIFSDSLYLKNIPLQPGENTWKFIEDLKSPMWTHHAWKPKTPGSHQANLSIGVSIQDSFPDPKKRLETAFDDLRSFLAAGDISCDNDSYIIVTKENKNLKGESFIIDVKPDSCFIYAGDVEGIRRGIFYIEDMMLRSRGPFLPLGTIEKNPVIKRRVSRCFFGPIKRPPKMKDELMDEVNYYPEQYLNRLAHEGVNGLWLTVEFRDLVSTKYTPDAGKDAKKRLAKLKKTVESCLRYGIRTYIFCIEPRAWEADSPVIKNYPELAGAPRGKGNFFCPMSQTAHKYLYESVNKIFRAVPELGGMINITHGERGTTCLSAVPAISDFKGKINCPRCSGKEPWEILHASLSAMEQGMHDASPDAELISWLYMPQPQRFVTGDSFALADWVYDLPAHTPDGVILQFNFESGVKRTEFGKLLVGGDYWISNPGPSSRFERIADVARRNGTSVSAKIQTGNSHEVATTPYVPLPSLLYRKFAAMHRLGVSHTMLCWYFGNYPGLMNKAAGMLSMEPFPTDEHTFMKQLASIYWKKEDVSKVVKAWKYFSDGYENYPLTNMFQYYGPMHDGPVWPLLLKPVDAPLSPTWQIGSSRTLKDWPPSGDRVGECIGEILTLEEVVELTGRITKSWDVGVKLFEEIEQNYTNEPERISDIGVAKALGIQFHSGYNILHFYLLREKMLRMAGRKRLNILNQLTDIIHSELELDKQLLFLCENDSRLGFHSEAEGYKYFPDKIRWRMDQLKSVLKNDVPILKKSILDDKLLFPEYTGLQPQGAVSYCTASKDTAFPKSKDMPPNKLQWQKCTYGQKENEIRWASEWNKNSLLIWISAKGNSDHKKSSSPINNVQIKIEPQRLYPCRRFVYDLSNGHTDDNLVFVNNKSGIYYVKVHIPFEKAGITSTDLHPIRIDVRVQTGNGETNSWRPDNPLTPRLLLGSDNPADLGWLVFDHTSSPSDGHTNE